MLVIGHRRADASRRTWTVGEERALEVSGLAGGALRDASFLVNAGEIVGLTGFGGSGYDNVPYLS